MELMLEQGKGRSWVSLSWSWSGRDLSVTLLGGERPHIGAVSLAFCQDGGVEVQTISVPGHREEALTADCARKLAAVLSCTVQVSGGIHIDCASSQEILLLCKNAESLVDQLVKILRQPACQDQDSRG